MVMRQFGATIDRTTNNRRAETFNWRLLTNFTNLIGQLIHWPLYNSEMIMSTCTCSVCLSNKPINCNCNCN